jgi:hypothetical protein
MVNPGHVAPVWADYDVLETRSSQVIKAMCRFSSHAINQEIIASV